MASTYSRCRFLSLDFLLLSFLSNRLLLQFLNRRIWYRRWCKRSLTLYKLCFPCRDCVFTCLDLFDISFDVYNMSWKWLESGEEKGDKDVQRLREQRAGLLCLRLCRPFRSIKMNGMGEIDEKV